MLKWNVDDKYQLTALTSRVSHPPTMLRPRPTFPLQNSMVVSLPATTGQLRGSEVVGADPGKSDCPVGEVCIVLGDEEEETGREAGEREQGWERDAEGGSEEEDGRLLERLMESLTVTRCLRIKLDTWIQRRQVSHKSLNQLDLVCQRVCVSECVCTLSTDSPATGSSPTAMILSPTLILPSCTQTETWI